MIARNEQLKETSTEYENKRTVAKQQIKREWTRRGVIKSIQDMSVAPIHTCKKQGKTKRRRRIDKWLLLYCQLNPPVPVPWYKNCFQRR